MRCPDCKRQMTLLFISYVCDYCDGIASVDLQRGFIVFRGDDDFERPVYVFPTRTDAAQYRSIQKWQQHPIREVWFERVVPWKPAASKLAGITIALRPFTLHRDRRFEPLEYHAFLVPLSSAA